MKYYFSKKQDRYKASVNKCSLGTKFKLSVRCARFWTGKEWVVTYVILETVWCIYMQDCMTWLTAVTQLGSVICKSFRPVDLTTEGTGFLVSQCFFFLMYLNSGGAWSVIYYINIYNFVPDIKGLFILSPEHLKKKFALEWAAIV